MKTAMYRAFGRTCATLAVMGLITTLASAQDGLVPQWLFDGPDAEDELEEWGAQNDVLALELDEVKDAAGETRGVLISESTGGVRTYSQAATGTSPTTSPSPATYTTSCR